MPKLMHEAVVHLVRSAPGMLAELLRTQLGIDLPVHASPRLSAAEFVDLHLAEYRADAVLLVGDADRPREAFVVEAQGRVDLDKEWTLPQYLTGLRLRLRCRVTLVIVAPDAEVARRCAGPIRLGRGDNVVTPFVLGPRQIPVVTAPEEALRCPELAVLSVIAHGQEPGAEHIALAALAGTRDLDSDQALIYADIVRGMLGPIARTALEQLMNRHNYEFQSEFARKYFGAGKTEGAAEGLARGKAETLLVLLRHRGLAPDAALQARVLECRDLATLDRWIERSLAATRLDDVFAA